MKQTEVENLKDELAASHNFINHLWEDKKKADKMIKEILLALKKSQNDG